MKERKWDAPKNSPREFGCSIFAALMAGPKTRLELMELCGNHKSVERWLDAMRGAGLVYIHRYNWQPRGQHTAVFSIQPSVGLFDDAPPTWKPRKRAAKGHDLSGIPKLIKSDNIHKVDNIPTTEFSLHNAWMIQGSSE